MSDRGCVSDRRFQAQDLLDVLDEVGVDLRLEGERAVIARPSRRHASSTLAWRVKLLEAELVELRAKAERIRKGAVS